MDLQFATLQACINGVSATVTNLAKDMTVALPILQDLRTENEVLKGEVKLLRSVIQTLSAKLDSLQQGQDAGTEEAYKSLRKEKRKSADPSAFATVLDDAHIFGASDADHVDRKLYAQVAATSWDAASSLEPTPEWTAAKLAFFDLVKKRVGPTSLDVKFRAFLSA